MTMGPCALHELDGRPTAHLVTLATDHVIVVAKRLDVHHHNLERVRRREVAEPVDTMRFVNEVLAWQIVVECSEMLSRHLEVLEHSFANGDARDNDDKLLKAVALGQFEDRAEVDVGLPRSRLHLYREVRTMPLDFGDGVTQRPRLEISLGVLDLYVVSLLHCASVLSQRIVVQ